MHFLISGALANEWACGYNIMESTEVSQYLLDKIRILYLVYM
jgi:hypothetical protein